MIRHFSLVVLEIAAGLLLVLMLGVGLVGWRLTQGPLEVAALTPYLEQALNENAPVRTEIGSTVLSWAGFGAPLEVKAVDVVAYGRSGSAVASLPELKLQFSLPAALRGRAALTRFELVRPWLKVLRTEDGSFTLDIRNEDLAAEEGAGEAIAAELLESLRRPPDLLDPLGAITELRISEARLQVEDQRRNLTWSAPRLDLSLLRDAGGITGEAGLDLELSGRTNHLQVSIAYTFADGHLEMQSRFDAVRPADFSQIAPVLEPLQALDVSFSGTAAAAFSADLKPLHVSLALTGGAGRLILPDQLPAPVAFDHVQLLGRLLEGGRRLDVDRFELDLGRPKLTAAGSVRRGDEALTLTLRTELVKLTAEDLARYWPPSLKPKARTWMVENLTRGSYDRTEFELEATAPADDPAALEPTRMQGRFAFSGFDVRYMETLPPVTGVSGTAVFDGRAFDIRLGAGRLKDMTLGPSSTVQIYNLEGDPEFIDIDVAVSGPVSSALEVLDHEPLRYAQKVNLDPRSVGGTADLRLRFDFPLLGDLEWEEVTMQTSGTLAGVKVAGIVPDITGTEGRFDIVVTPKDLRLAGTALLNGVPSAIEWQEFFPKAAPVGTRVRIKAALDDGGRAALGLDFPEWLNGPAAVDMTYEKTDRGAESIVADLDLTESVLRIDPLHWRKPAGLPGRGALRVEFVGGKPVHLPRLTVQTAELAAAGRLDLRPQDYGIARLVLDTFRLGETDARMVLEGRPKDGLAIDLRGRSFDARPLREDDKDGAAGDDGAEPVRPLEITFDLDRIVMGDEGQALRAAKGSASRTEAGWRSAVLDARVGDTGSLKVRYSPEGDRLALAMESDDAGAALRELGILSQIRGGTLSVTGHSTPGDARETVAGRIDLRDYEVKDAPVLARLLSAASPRGFADFLGGQPISFSRLVGDFRWHRRGISFREVRTSGSAVGLTLEGDIDIKDGVAALQGTIVPFSTVNRLIGAIPLVGGLLVGGEGQGLFAATYSVKGPLGDPQIGVNPLAVLAPGFLRNLFFLPEPAGEGGETPKKEPQKSGDGGAPRSGATPPK